MFTLKSATRSQACNHILVTSKLVEEVEYLLTHNSNSLLNVFLRCKSLKMRMRNLFLIIYKCNVYTSVFHRHDTERRLYD